MGNTRFWQCFLIMGITLSLFLLPDRAVLAFEFNITVNGKPITIGKDANEPKDANAPKENTPVTKPDTQQADTSGELNRVSGKGVYGPDIMGMQIGMTAPEAIKFLSSKGFEINKEPSSMDMNDKHKNKKEDLPYLMKIFALTKTPYPVKENEISIMFTPLSGRERTMSIFRKVSFPDGKQPTWDTFIKSVFEKYGSPTYEHSILFKGIKEPANYWWLFDKNGVPLKPDPAFAKAFANGADRLTCFAPLTTHRGEQLYTYSMDEIIKIDHSLPASCGGIYIQMTGLGFVGKFTGGNTLVKNYWISMDSYDEYMGSAKEARELLDGIHAKENKRAVEIGKEQKPDL